jgi:TPR repeat protein
VRKYQNRICPAHLIPNLSDEFIHQSGKASQVVITRSPIEELRRMAEEGDARSQIHFGEFLQNGEGIDRNVGEAVRYFRIAANQGDAESMIALGVCLKNGKGISCDPKASMDLFKRAADLGVAEGQDWLAFCRRNRIGCFEDWAEAARLFTIAADTGHGLAASAESVCGNEKTGGELYFH